MHDEYKHKPELFLAYENNATTRIKYGSEDYISEIIYPGASLVVSTDPEASEINFITQGRDYYRLGEIDRTYRIVYPSLHEITAVLKSAAYRVLEPHRNDLIRYGTQDRRIYREQQTTKKRFNQIHPNALKPRG